MPKLNPPTEDWEDDESLCVWDAADIWMSSGYDEDYMFGYTEEEPGYTSLFVEDTGKGISEDGLRHIFERFYKVDSFTQGAGLGLSICQTIVGRLNGTITVASEEGHGTRFTVRLPDICE